MMNSQRNKSGFNENRKITYGLRREIAETNQRTKIRGGERKPSISHHQRKQEGRELRFS